MKVDIKISNLSWLFLMLIVVSLMVLSCQNSDGNRQVSEHIQDMGNLVVPEHVDFNFHVKPILSDRCFKCHGPDKSKIEANLSFVNFESATIPLGENQDRFAIVPHSIEKSELVSRITSDNEDVVMPPPDSHLSLSEYEKSVLIKWIEQGATYKKHWSLLPVQNKIVEKNPNENLVYNAIDNFILKKVDGLNLSASPLAEREYLIRRIAFTITGLPPTNEEIDQFLDDSSSDAVERLLDQYLNRQSYGEHMAAYWMDLARYADTHGYQDDLERVMWPWRDWVISAFNRNLAYDDFVTYQLAGDLLPNASKEQIIATAFNRNHSITQEGGVIPEEYRTEYVADRTMTFGKAFLGLSFECARCHDHKYDPISQKEYYSLFSFFNNVPEKGLIENYGAIPEPYIEITKEEVDSILTFINNLDSLEKIPLLVMEEMAHPRETFILDRGLYNKPKEKVEANVPQAILEFDASVPNRLGLANWLFEEKNPLTARVAVNRLWQLCFGTGLVSTSDDFGAQGALPSHPELLDHLAAKFMDDGWDIKKMMKYIMMSRTFQQSSKVSEELLLADPENRFYARAPRLRLSAESIRDNILASSGLLVDVVGGPSVKPYQPDGLWKEKTGGGGGSTAEYRVDEDGGKYRRSLYTFWKRTVPPPSMMTFDAVSRDFCMVDRETTSTPLQALVMMNNPEVIEAAQHMAHELVRVEMDEEERISKIFRNATSRVPSVKEMNGLREYLSEQREHFRTNDSILNEYLESEVVDSEKEIDRIEVAAYSMLATVIFNLDESMTRS